MTALITMFAHYNWTLDNVVMMLFGIIAVELLRMRGRSASPAAIKTKFKFSYWIAQRNNWLSPLITVLFAFIALALKEGLCPPGLNPLLYAFGAGAMGQALIKIAMKAVGAPPAEANTVKPEESQQ